MTYLLKAYQARKMNEALRRGDMRRKPKATVERGRLSYSYEAKTPDGKPYRVKTSFDSILWFMPEKDRQEIYNKFGGRTLGGKDARNPEPPGKGMNGMTRRQLRRF